MNIGYTQNVTVPPPTRIQASATKTGPAAPVSLSPSLSKALKQRKTVREQNMSVQVKRSRCQERNKQHNRGCVAAFLLLSVTHIPLVPTTNLIGITIAPSHLESLSGL
jgi:hypothetical protein